ncbi:hypothetical protein LCGC14_1911700 [marine sediment metagenome]|uniref:Uncharacterized protein n=1 Tax=marine sediment metagenome TaxID=412755 RepID=A0A0F9IRG2_9ZZZZ
MILLNIFFKIETFKSLSLFERYNLIKREINLKNGIGRNPYLDSITQKGLDVLKIKLIIK